MVTQITANRSNHKWRACLVPRLSNSTLHTGLTLATWSRWAIGGGWLQSPATDGPPWWCWHKAFGWGFDSFHLTAALILANRHGMRNHHLALIKPYHKRLSNETTVFTDGFYLFWIQVHPWLSLNYVDPYLRQITHNGRWTHQTESTTSYHFIPKETIKYLTLCIRNQTNLGRITLLLWYHDFQTQMRDEQFWFGVQNLLSMNGMKWDVMTHFSSHVILQIVYFKASSVAYRLFDIIRPV